MGGGELPRLEPSKELLRAGAPIASRASEVIPPAQGLCPHPGLRAARGVCAGRAAHPRPAGTDHLQSEGRDRPRSPPSRRGGSGPQDGRGGFRLGEVFAQAEVASPANNGVRARLCALVDTGSSYTIIPPQLVRRLGLLVVDREELNTAKDETVPGRIVEASLRVGAGAGDR